jgi:voltage-gated potassium channel
MYTIKIRSLFGLSGVDNHENPTALKWGHRFEFAMVLIAIWLPLQWYLERTHEIAHILAETASWVVWLFFVAETLTMITLTTRKTNYILKNWMNLVIIIVGLPPLWMNTPWLAVLRLLQLLLILRLLLPAWDSAIKILSRNRLGTTLIVACIITIFWGVLMSIIDPDIKTPWDGIWLAWETVTTVGFGDIVPISTIGRILDIILMIMGVGLISLLTANFSAYFIGQNTEALKREDDQTHKIVKEMQKQLTEIQQLLDELTKKRE